MRGGSVIIVRYADDFVMGFQDRGDAERCLRELRGRFEQFGLQLHPEKTRLIEFRSLCGGTTREAGTGQAGDVQLSGLHALLRDHAGRERSRLGVSRGQTDAQEAQGDQESAQRNACTRRRSERADGCYRRARVV